VPLQLGQIIERIGSVQLAGMDHAHEQIADPGAVQRLIEECAFADRIALPVARLLHVERDFSRGKRRNARHGGAVLRVSDTQWPRCAVAAGNRRGKRTVTHYWRTTE
jgi:hypothetical protein